MPTQLTHLRNWALGALLIGALGACAPVVSQRGYVPDAEKLASIKTGVDTKQSVVERLGSPSTIANFESSVWYYISETENQIAWKYPEVADRKIVAVEFDLESRVKDVREYTMADGREITPVARKTPTKGRELSFWEQMFGNIGRLPGAGGPENPGK